MLLLLLRLLAQIDRFGPNQQTLIADNGGPPAAAPQVPHPTVQALAIVAIQRQWLAFVSKTSVHHDLELEMLISDILR